jgi:hypothetical protein
MAAVTDIRFAVAAGTQWTWCSHRGCCSALHKHSDPVAMICPVASEVAICRGIGLLCRVGECSKDRSLTRWMEAPLSIMKLRASGNTAVDVKTLRVIVAVIPDGGGYPPGKKLVVRSLSSGSRAAAAVAGFSVLGRRLAIAAMTCFTF